MLEKGLRERVEIVLARTRVADSPYYRINPSGRVPYLVLDDGTALEESAYICRYLDEIDGAPAFALPDGESAWEARRLDALARSLLDGLAVWLRELYRPENERSPGTIRHESARAARLFDAWEREVAQPPMRGPLNMPQLTLACALGIEMRLPGLDWRTGHPKLVAWYEPIAARPSFLATQPK